MRLTEGTRKLTSAFVISGYAENKTIVLTGSGTGRGELSGNMADPYDRKGKATTTLIKSGTGRWTLSGTNSCTGPTMIKQGTLSLPHARSLGANTEIAIASGARLEVNFKGQMTLRKLTLDGKPQPPGIYTATSSPEFLKGDGTLAVQP